MSTATRSPRLKGLSVVLLGSLVFVIVVAVVNGLAKSLLARTVASGLRQRVTAELSAALFAEVAVLLALTLFLRGRGVTLRSLGLWQSAPLRGWVVAGLVAALFISFTLAVPLRAAENNLAEVSLFRVYNALVAAFVAGFVEEILFRGFVMTELQSSGWSKAAQVVISSLVYGAVHATWGVVTGMFTWELVGGAVIGTSVFGCFCAVTYLISRRSLMPVIVSHAAINLAIEPWMFMLAVSMVHH